MKIFYLPLWEKILIIMSVHPEEINVFDLLPQRPPFIMIDKLTYFDPVSAKTIFKIREDNLFCKDGVMEETGLIENIAQTCAAHTGFKQRPENDSSEISEVAGPTSNTPCDKIKIGVIVMINSLEIKRCPLAGEVLETLMRIEEEFFSTIGVQSEVHTGDETIAICKMKLLLTDKTPDR